jgi:predicted ester cyclase
MLALVQELARAKSQQDVIGALEVQHSEMLLESPAFGSVARGRNDNARVLQRFFKTFPDYHVELEGYACSEESLVCWGKVRMTMTGARFGVVTNGSRAELPVFMRFTFRDDLIASEYFLIDLATLCQQSGVSTDAVLQTLFPRGQSGRT